MMTTPRNLTAIVLLACVAAFSVPPPTADQIMADARAQAASQNKSILLIFHASWCSWCRQFEKFISSRDVEPIISRHFVIARVDVQERGDKKSLDTPGGDELMAAMGGGDAGGLPFFAFVDSNGKLIVNSLRPAGGKSENIGHPVAPEEVDWFMTMLAKAVPGLTKPESRAVERYLRNQKRK
ncbi:MAG TPA: thioredoxin family protein [Terriglobia bacterium]|nr:thioredoxin family protein [Terriglobia bacterium]